MANNSTDATIKTYNQTISSIDVTPDACYGPSDTETGMSEK